MIDFTEFYVYCMIDCMTASFHEVKRFYCSSGSKGNDSMIDFTEFYVYCMIDCMTRVIVVILQ